MWQGKQNKSDTSNILKPSACCQQTWETVPYNCNVDVSFHCGSVAKSNL